MTIGVKLFTSDFCEVFSRLFLCRKRNMMGHVTSDGRESGRKEPKKMGDKYFIGKSLTEFCTHIASVCSDFARFSFGH